MTHPEVGWLQLGLDNLKKKDLFPAMGFFLMAAKTGLGEYPSVEAIEAQYQLGVVYYSLAVYNNPYDYRNCETIKWFKIAAERGHELARLNLANLEFKRFKFDLKDTLRDFEESLYIRSNKLRKVRIPKLKLAKVQSEADIVTSSKRRKKHRVKKTTT